MLESVEVEQQWLKEIIISKLLKNGDFLKTYEESSASTFAIRDIAITFIGVDEAFMLTVCYRARITFEYRGTIESRNLVVKKTPVLPQATFDTINFAALFGNEINAYKTIMPAFAEIAKYDFNLTKLYFGEVHANYAITIMEDFTAKGWHLTNTPVNLSLEHILVTVRYLAKFHGCGFAMRTTQRERFDNLAALLKESRFAKSTVHEDYFILCQQLNDRFIRAIEQYQPSVPLEIIQQLGRRQKNFHHNNKKRIAPVEPIITLCHGDFLRNNIAFKYDDEEHENPIDVMMFDLQTLRVGSPMLDLTIFLSLSSFAEVRYNNFELIFNTYCDELAKAFKAYTGSEILPKYLGSHELRMEFIRLLPYSISITSNFLSLIADPEVDITREELLTRKRSLEQIKEDAKTRGGVAVDKEFAHQVKELYDMMQKYNIDVFEDCDY